MVAADMMAYTTAGFKHYLGTGKAGSWRFVERYQELHDGKQVDEPLEEDVFLLGVAGCTEFVLEQLVLFEGEIERVQFLQRGLSLAFFYYRNITLRPGGVKVKMLPLSACAGGGCTGVGRSRL